MLHVLRLVYNIIKKRKCKGKNPKFCKILKK